MSTVNTPTYKLAKFLVPILKSLTSNEYTVKDSFAFAEGIVEQDSEFFMGSLDVDSLFINIPLEEIIDVCANTHFENTERVEGLSKIEFKSFYLLLQNNPILFLMESSTGKSMYWQVDEVAMGSPLGLTLANAFLCTCCIIVHLTLSLITTGSMLM